MKEREFLIELIKATPNNSIIEFLLGHIETNDAKSLGLIDFDSFTPKSVRPIFYIDSTNRTKIIDYFNNADISDFVLYYKVSKDESIIARGFDNCTENWFDQNFYNNAFEQFSKDYKINFRKKLKGDVPGKKRDVIFSKVSEYHGNYSANISLMFYKKLLNLRFAIEPTDYKILSGLLNELKSTEKLVFSGDYSSSKNSQELQLTIKTQKADIDVIIDSTRKLISNLLWFQNINSKSDIEHLIVV